MLDGSPMLMSPLEFLWSGKASRARPPAATNAIDSRKPQALQSRRAEAAHASLRGHVRHGYGDWQRRRLIEAVADGQRARSGGAAGNRNVCAANGRGCVRRAACCCKGACVTVLGGRKGLRKGRAGAVQRQVR